MPAGKTTIKKMPKDGEAHGSSKDKRDEKAGRKGTTKNNSPIGNINTKRKAK